jgi:predicted Ser/Thr protein kinase
VATLQLTELKAGTVIGDFVLEAKIGDGSYGAVYRAHERELGTPVAIKMLKHEASHNPVSVSRFQREARAATTIQHPAVVSVFDVGTFEGSPFIVMEHLEGADLRTYLEKHGALDPEEVVGLLYEAADALDDVHELGILHRDLKLENLFRTNDGHVKVLDWGIAKLQPEDADTFRTGTGAFVGTPGYFPPEQFSKNFRNMDRRGDVFSLGVAAFELITGRRPWHWRELHEYLTAINGMAPMDAHVLRPTVPRRFAKVITGALAREPKERPPTAGDFVRRLARELPNGAQVIADRAQSLALRKSGALGLRDDDAATVRIAAATDPVPEPIPEFVESSLSGADTTSSPRGHGTDEALAAPAPERLPTFVPHDADPTRLPTLVPSRIATVVPERIPTLVPARPLAHVSELDAPSHARPTLRFAAPVPASSPTARPTPVAPSSSAPTSAPQPTDITPPVAPEPARRVPPPPSATPILPSAPALNARDPRSRLRWAMALAAVLACGAFAAMLLRASRAPEAMVVAARDASTTHTPRSHTPPAAEHAAPSEPTTLRADEIAARPSVDAGVDGDATVAADAAGEQPAPTPPPGKLDVFATNALTDVYVRGVFKGTTPLENLSLPAGRAVIELRSKGRREKLTIQIRSGRTNRLTHTWTTP